MILHIEARDIPDAWFQAVYGMLQHGYRYTIEHGSFVGQQRIEVDFAVIQINCPYQEPWDQMLPEIPGALGIPNPVAPGYVERYMPYLMTGERQEGEDYTYGSRLCGPPSQIDWIIKLLRKTPNTNTRSAPQ